MKSSKWKHGKLKSAIEITFLSMLGCAYSSAAGQLKRADSLSTRKRKITFFIARKISFGVLIPTK